MGKSSGGIRNTKTINQNEKIPENRKDFLEFLKSTELPLVEEKSFKWGSEYYSIDGFSFRISDHAKPKGSFGHETYSQGNDFRSYREAFLALKKRGIKSAKKDREAFYKKNRSKIIKDKMGELTVYKNPLGYAFDSIDNALNNWFLLSRKK